MALRRNNYFKFITERAKQVGKAPRRKGLTTSGIEDKRYFIDDFDDVEVMHEQVENFRSHFGFKVTTVSGEVHKHL